MRMPSVQPTATSATFRTFGSRLKPSAMSRAVEAKRGWSWPSTVSANAYAPTAHSAMRAACEAEERTRAQPDRARRRTNTPTRPRRVAGGTAGRVPVAVAKRSVMPHTLCRATRRGAARVAE